VNEGRIRLNYKDIYLCRIRRFCFRFLDVLKLETTQYIALTYVILDLMV
jgi:hypothetical protein